MKPKGMQLSWITVSDIKSAMKFYTETIGFKLCEFHEEFGWAELSGKEGARLGLAQVNAHDGFKPGSNAVVTITVEDIEAARKDLLQRKVHLIGEILEIPGEVKMQTFKDSDGNTFQLCELLKEF